jgi:PKD repeat protein
VSSAYPYRGFWRIGGDNLANWANRGTSDYLAGSIDEVAIYPTALTGTQIAQHYSRGLGGDGNLVPTAAFSSSANRLVASFDASQSSDGDGTIASYAWDFGDGTTDTGVTPSHTYATAGTYQVTLKVTDNGGKTASVTKAVTVAENVSPTASFTSSANNLAVSFNGTGSTDPDGTISSYAWNFGDGSTGTGSTTSHTYAAAGTYTVQLTVTDNDGGVGSTTRTVTVATAPTGAIASDTFGRTVSGGWGSANTGGSWTRYGTSTLFSVDGSVGRITMSSAGVGPRANLTSLNLTSSDTTVKVALSKRPSGATGSSPYNFVGMAGRAVGTDEYRAKVRVANTGATTLYLTRLAGGTETTLRTVSLGSGLTYTAGTQLQIRTQVYGTSPTTIRAKVWRVGSTEPSAWTTTITDSTASLQRAGGVGLLTYVSGNATNLPIVASFDDLVVNAGP